ALLKRNARQQITQERTVGAMKELAQALRLPDVPSRLEGFDISNTQGAQSVASMVVFVDGVPSKKDYRRFNIKTVEGANDFASMGEALQRRFRRAKADSDSERWPLPELILVDGGPEQLRFAREAMQDEGFDVPIFALAERQEEIWLPGARTPLMLDRHSPALHLIQRVRDESHRFAITHHRKRRGKAAIRSRLEEVPGIGPARRRALLAAFRTIKAIGEASVEELLQVKGMTRPAAEALYSAMHPDQPDTPADAGNFADA
ncbi:MAG: excinuclease ABC subunit C, partial [Clostridiales bacterium]|nr:excinuclease ABC subunit C [Clostridiales bacterium]